MTKRKRRSFTPEFKEQIVKLYLNGKSRAVIIREYDLSASAFDKWVKQHQETGSFNAVDKKTAGQKEFEELRKQNKQLLMENDYLKLAALIMGRK